MLFEIDLVAVSEKRKSKRHMILMALWYYGSPCVLTELVGLCACSARHTAAMDRKVPIVLPLC